MVPRLVGSGKGRVGRIMMRLVVGTVGCVRLLADIGIDRQDRRGLRPTTRERGCDDGTIG